MVKPKTPEELKVATVGTIRKWYADLAKNHDAILNEKLKQCQHCGDWLSTETGFYRDDRFCGGRFYICKQCIQAMVEQRKKKTDIPNETKESVQRVLQMMDLPYIDTLYEDCEKGAYDAIKERNRRSPFATYITCIKSLPQHKGKKWKDSVFPKTFGSSDYEANPKIVEIFGKGFSNEDYEYLQGQFNDWCSRTQVDSKAQEMYVVQICLQSLDVYKDRRMGKDVTNKLKALDNLMSSANLQPKQNVNSAASDSLTFGQLIEKWEEEKPIPEPSEEFKDVDGIGKYIRVWFMGHLAKMLGLKNAYSKEYEEEIAKYTVTKPQLQEEGRSEEIYQVMFGKGDD